jgi:hypothetical protein
MYTLMLRKSHLLRNMWTKKVNIEEKVDDKGVANDDTVDSFSVSGKLGGGEAVPVTQLGFSLPEISSFEGREEEDSSTMS